MARVRMVTRTIENTRAFVKAVDKEDYSRGVIEVVLELPTVVTDDKVKQELDKFYADEYAIVEVIKTEVQERLLGMLESDFIKYAKPLDTETRKMIEE